MYKRQGTNKTDIVIMVGAVILSTICILINSGLKYSTIPLTMTCLLYTSRIYGKEFNLSKVTKEAFDTSSKIIFISSTGIAVRAISPLLQCKDKDPGIVVVDLSSNYAVSLVSRCV